MSASINAVETTQELFARAAKLLVDNQATCALEVVDALSASERRLPEFRQLAALAVKRQGNGDDALADLERLVTEYPLFYQAWYNLGVCYGERRAWLQAICCYRSCLAGLPEHADAKWNLADALRLEEQFEESLSLLTDLESHSVYGSLGDLYHRKGVCFVYLGQSDRACAAFDRALELGTSDRATTGWESSHALLHAGHYQLGFAAYEHRFAAFANGVTKHEFSGIAPWRGESLAGRVLLVHGEQGLGDEIMFAGWLPTLLAEGARLVLAVKPALVQLFRDSFASQTVLAHTVARPVDAGLLGDVDFEVAIGSIASLRDHPSGLTPDVGAGGYVSADVDKVGRFDRLLRDWTPAGRRGPRIGLAWGSNPCRDDASGARRAQQKSIQIQNLIKLRDALPDATFVSLQNHELASACGAGGALNIIDCHRYLADFADTAALAENLDLIISVDTSVAHLAGALDLPLWLLLMEHADWRWQRDGTHCRWYTQTRLFRQQQQGDWSTVIDDVCRALVECFGEAR